MTLLRIPRELDIECYRNFFLVKLYCTQTNKFYDFPMFDGHPLDIQGLVNMLARSTIYTFNGNNYDVPILTLALYGADNATLKAASDAIIVQNLKPWEFYNNYNIAVPEYIDHVDVMEPAPGVRIGLKMYMGRCHAPRMQDLPIEPAAWIEPMQRFELATYCGNDLDGTRIMRETLKDRLALRESIRERYGIDVRSKSDAQIAEAIIKHEILKFRNKDRGGYDEVKYIDRRYIPHGFAFNYVPPAYIRYATPELRELLEVIRNAQFVVSDKEEAMQLGIEDAVRTGVQIPNELKGRDIRIGQATYRLGIGGLHSQESCVSYYTIEGVQRLRDIDVKSYYPSLILGMGMYPEQLGPEFLDIYRTVYTRRLHAKDEADRIDKLYQAMGADELKRDAKEFKTEADGLKIVLNGTFGKLFSKYSILYAPEFGIRTTITGQLSLLMLIEMMELSGIRVVSANTDGIVLLIPNGLDRVAADVVRWWETQTGLEMEASDYRSIHFRDVNNYVAFTDKGKVKRKGIFAPPGLIENKHPDKEICVDAVIAWLKDGTVIEKTIKECADIRKFIVVRAVSGGGMYGDQYLGKAVRWYYSLNGASITYKSNGNKVAGSDGAMPCMELPKELPTDIDYAHYAQVAYEMLADIGIPVAYWYHPESDCVFITTDDEDGWSVTDGVCDRIDRKTYEKRKR